MKIVLAGYNIDAEIINELKTKSNWSENNVTPETLSAAYARISRDPSDITELREKARKEVDKARKSNETIIFGLGHASVAEHAVFNFDVIDVSRLAVEEIQRFRLASFTEKSQRYITLDGDFVMPDEIKEAGLNEEFEKTIEFQNKTYFELFDALKTYLFNKHSELVKTAQGARTVEGWAKEDARYVVSLATKSQFGMTVNARELEHILKKLGASKLKEVTSIASNLYESVKELSPSIIKYITPSKNDTIAAEKTRNLAQSFLPTNVAEPKNLTKMVYYTSFADTFLVAAILANFTGNSFENSLSTASCLSYDEQERLVKSALSCREFYDNVPRYFEMNEFVFECVVSASNYAQLKRHRMTTQIVSDYEVDFGVTLPPNIAEIKMENKFMEAIKRSEDFYFKLLKKVPECKNYILTNAHRRRVVLKINLRELYHFISLRDDDHAQWDIRNTAIDMRKLVESVMPLGAMMLSGKSGFEEKKRCCYLDYND